MCLDDMKSKKAMRIALITETYPPQINGVSRTLGMLTEHLSAKGHDVLVIHPEYGDLSSGLVIAPEYQDRIQIQTVPALPLPFYKEVLIPRPPFSNYKTVLSSFHPDLVHIATEGGLGLSALRYCKKRRWPVVSSFHTNFDAYASHYRMRWAVPVVARYLRWFHNRTLATYVPSTTMIHRLESLGFERLSLWPRGVNTSFFRPDRPGSKRIRDQFHIPVDATVIGHCGRLAPEKNIDYLADVFSQVLNESTNTHVLIVGDGPSRTALETKLKRLPHAFGRAHFTGYLTGDQLADAYSAMNLFAFSSRTETFGNVLLEAMASGLPVVAIAEGGPSDVVQDQVTGRLIDPKALPEEMTKILSQWISNKKLLNQIANNARTYAQKVTWERIMDGLFENYQVALKSFHSINSA